MNIGRILLFCFLLITGLYYVKSDFEDEGSYPDTFENEVDEEAEKILSSPDVKIEKLFPRFNDTMIPIGDVAEVLIGFINTGNKVFNVSVIRGSLLYLYDNSVFRNFTTYKYEQIVEPGDVVTFTYQFLCDYSLEPRDYGFQAWIYYTDNENFNYTNTFNYTINLFEPVTEFDFKSIFSYLLTLSFVGLGGFVFYSLRGDKKKSKSKKSNSGTSSDWSSGTLSSSFKKNKSGKLNTSTEKKITNKQ